MRREWRVEGKKKSWRRRVGEEQPAISFRQKERLVERVGRDGS